jgi:transposase-like protein|tara:strand:+ start:5169 stop:5429 length:261 start_codon:yes stop_codon:yes gene_type:complete
MSIDTLSPEDKAKLTQLVDEGCSVLQECEDLKGGLRDTVKAIADEFDIKPGVLNKAISLAHKAKLTEAKQDFADVEEVLETVGRTL